MQLYHNPRCSKSRDALQLLQERGFEPQIIPYLEQPPTPAELRELLRMLGIRARELIRTGEAEFEALGLGEPWLTEEKLIEAMATHPKLIERPILVHEGRAAIGRPPERLLEIL